MGFYASSNQDTTVCREIAEPRRETCVRSREDPRLRVLHAYRIGSHRSGMRYADNDRGTPLWMGARSASQKRDGTTQTAIVISSSRLHALACHPPPGH